MIRIPPDNIPFAMPMLACDSLESRGPQPRRAEARNGIRFVEFSAGCRPNVDTPFR